MRNQECFVHVVKPLQWRVEDDLCPVWSYFAKLAKEIHQGGIAAVIQGMARTPFVFWFTHWIAW